MGREKPSHQPLIRPADPPFFFRIRVAAFGVEGRPGRTGSEKKRREREREKALGTRIGI